MKWVLITEIWYQALSFSFARSGRRTGSGGTQAFVVCLDLRQHGVETIGHFTELVLAVLDGARRVGLLHGYSAHGPEQADNGL